MGAGSPKARGRLPQLGRSSGTSLASACSAAIPPQHRGSQLGSSPPRSGGGCGQHDKAQGNGASQSE